MIKIILTIIITSMLYACSNELPSGPKDLKIEYGSQVTDETHPRFSWILSDTSRGANQSGYQVIVASSASKLTDKKADIWNSGKVSSNQSVFVEYNGNALESGNTYYWKVRSWDNEEKVSTWSDHEKFYTGFYKKSDWKAAWIGAFESEVKQSDNRQRSILLRKEAELTSNIKEAKVYVTGLGSYQLFINGEKISRDLLAPGWTDYPQRILYQVYDVTENLSKGSNAFGILLGNVWYSSGLGWSGKNYYSNGPLMAMLQLDVTYTNGEKQTLITDESWKWHFSPIVENTLYNGETYDARLEIAGWNDKGLDVSDWDNADKFETRDAVLSAHSSPRIQVTREIKPVSVKKLENGSYVFDMGLNLTGGIRLSVSGEKGTEIVMKFAELLHEDGSVAQENLRTAKATDRYILKGEGLETWEPAFTYHGFRYVEISGLPAEPGDQTVTALNYHNAAPETGSFECSNDLINTIQANIQNGQRSNMFSVPTDCPQRDERLGWMGDAQIFAATSCYNMDMSGFYAKWIRDIADSQSDEGWVTDVNPAIVVTVNAKPGWGDAFTVVPWEQYRFYRDTRILEKFYDDYKQWVEYMRTNVDADGLYIYDRNGWGGFGDWIAVVSSPKEPISAAYYYYSTMLVAKFAEILGYDDDLTEYTQLGEQIKESFNKRFLDEKNASYPEGTQAALLLPLNFGLTPPDMEEPVIENLKNDVVERGYHPTTGFLGTKYILPTLSDNGHHDVAWKTAINTDYPSWGYMVKNGATSMWELWNSDSEPPDQMNSRNHFALGSVGEWYYSHLAGIRIDDENPGFKHSIIAPLPAEDLDWAKGSIKTPYGTLSTSWKKNKEQFTLDVVIPPNTTSTIVIPNSENMNRLYESGNLIVESGKLAEGIANMTLKSATDQSITLEIPAGHYSFTLK